MRAPTSSLSSIVTPYGCCTDRSPFILEKWPGGPDPREQESLQRMKTLLTAALLECSLEQDGER